MHTKMLFLGSSIGLPQGYEMNKISSFPCDSAFIFRPLWSAHCALGADYQSDDILPATSLL